MQSHGKHAQANDSGIIFRTPFNYAFLPHQTDPTARLPESDLTALYAALDGLAEAMVDQNGDDNDAMIPAVFTYWGQFIDHDVTLFTNRDTQGITNISEEVAPKSFGAITNQLTNGRIPTLNLDNLYGSGPSFSSAYPSESQFLYDRNTPERFIIGENTDTGVGETPPLAENLHRDLPRGTDMKAKIADARNDENLIIAQFHLAFLRFHNAVVDAIQGEGRSGFDEAQKLVRFHYQWLVVNQYLRAIVEEAEVDNALSPYADNIVIRDGETFMPLEFAAGAFRFGHSMVRASYDFNRNFGRENVLLPEASFALLFQFTGSGFPEPFLGQASTLPANWIIEWERFVAINGENQASRKMDTKLSMPLSEMQNEGNQTDLPMDIRTLHKHLAKRNLRRGYQLRLPTGQAVCKSLGLTPLNAQELKEGTSSTVQEALDKGSFAYRTPLWFYTLREAEVVHDGNRLGPMGSRLLAKTIVGLIKADKESYLNADWAPKDSPLRSSDGTPLDSIEKIFKFAGVMV